MQKVTSSKLDNTKPKLKSGLEKVVYDYLSKKKIKFTYEGLRIDVTQPAQKRYYRPDFPIDNSFIVETKGQFVTADRKKHKIIKEQYPELDIRFIFSNSKTKIGKKSKTTYGKWCELHGFKYHCVQSTKEPFPKEWLKEIENNGKSKD